VNSGTGYSLLYSLERNGLIKGLWNQQKRVYILTEKGEQNTKVITKANEEIQNFIRNMSLLKD
jgi:DNA-binding PadR family transcriptional regulator